jgi:hypothetical protein
MPKGEAVRTAGIRTENVLLSGRVMSLTPLGLETAIKPTTASLGSCDGRPIYLLLSYRVFHKINTWNVLT